MIPGMARGRKPGEPTQQFNFRIPLRLLQGLDERIEEAEKAGYGGATRTGLVIAAIEKYLEKLPTTGKNKKG
jgi:hypothetical protein